MPTADFIKPDDALPEFTDNSNTTQFTIVILSNNFQYHIILRTRASFMICVGAIACGTVDFLFVYSFLRITWLGFI